MLKKLLHKHISFVTFLRHLFIPHHGNDYKPHFFREHVILSILIGSIFLLLISFTSYTVLRTTAFGTHVVTSSLVTLTNNARVQHGIPPLTRNIRLEQAAYLKARDMETKQYFAHYAPDGTTPWHWFDVTGYRFIYAGENLGLNFKSSADVEKAWLASKKHRDNILNTNYDDIGIAVVQGNTDTIPTLFIVQLFGKPETSNHNGALYEKVQWYELFIFNISRYIDSIYLTFIGILVLALIAMIGIEVRKQHAQHIVYGLLLMIIVSICAVINSLLI
jgi:accessory gene regulator protein AgrB